MSIPRMREGPSMQLQTAGSTGSTEEGRLSAAAGSRRDAASTIPEDLPGDAAAAPTPPPAAAAAQESAAAGDKDGGGSGGGGSRLGDGERGTVLPSLGAEVKSEDNEIHHYAQAGDVEEVRRCLLGGVNKVDEVDELGCTPLHLAGAMGHTDVVRLLVEEHGAAVDARDGARCTALHAASEGGYPVVVEMLLRLGAEIDARNSKQQTPLHYACGYGQVDAVHQLVIRGASAGVRDGNGNTPLHLACREGGADVVRLLLANGAPVDALNHRGRRPLHLACRNGRLEAAVTLLDHRADPSGRDGNGMQALDMIGAGRRIPQGLRLDLVHTLERYQMGEYAMSRRPLSSTKSLRPMWRERDSNSAGTPRAPFGPLGTATGAAAMAPGAASSAAGGVSGAGSLGSFETAAGSTRYPRRGFFAHGDSSIDGYSTGGASFWGGGEARVPEEGGGVGGPLSGGAAAAAAAAAAEAAAAAGMTTARGGPLSSRSGRVGGGGGGGVVGGGRSPRWTVGAAVAGRLEEMRARELGASLRAKVQENEAMKRYVDSVTEEMRALQLRVSRQSSPGPLSSTLPPPPPPPLSPSSFASAVGGGHLPRRAEGGASPSIAEMVARGVYGIDGIVGRQQHTSSGGGSGGSGSGGGDGEGSGRGGGGDGRMFGSARNPGLPFGGSAAASAGVVGVDRTGAVGTEGTARMERVGGGGDGDGSAAVHLHGTAPREMDVSGDDPAGAETAAAATAATAATATDPSAAQVPRHPEATAGDGGYSAEGSGAAETGERAGAGPGAGQGTGSEAGGRANSVSMSQLLDAKRAQLQSILDAPHARA